MAYQKEFKVGFPQQMSWCLLPLMEIPKFFLKYSLCMFLKVQKLLTLHMAMECFGEM